MRNRLAASFLLLTLLVLAVFTAVRLTTQLDLIRESEAAHLEHDATVLALVLDSGVDSGAGTGRDGRVEVRRLLESGQQATVELGDGGSETVTGEDYTTGDGDALLARADSGSVSVTLRQDSEVVRAVFRDSLKPVVALTAVLAVVAAVLGFLLSGLLVRPFQRLAVAAAALGRGRSDLDLPRSRVPEVKALAEALASSATRLRREVKRDQEFLQEASHRLRTPMTGMRLELEELQLRRDLDPEVRSTVGRSIRGLDDLQELTTGVFALARAARGGFGHVQVSVEELAQQTANAWAASLRGQQVEVKVRVEGSPKEQLTPGPFEQVLDLALIDLVQHSARSTVHLSITVSGEQVILHLRTEDVSADATADVSAGSSQDIAGGTGHDSGPHRDRPTLQSVVAMVDLLGGRSAGDPAGNGLRVWLPLW